MKPDKVLRVVGRRIVETRPRVESPTFVQTPERAWLVQFEYEEYCQGYEWTWTYLLVYAPTFREACNKILTRSKEYYNAREFKDMTIL